MWIIDDYWWLLMIIIVDWWLLMIIDDSNILMDYWWLLMIIIVDWWLLMIIDDYWLLLLLIDDYWWLLMILISSWIIDDYWWLLLLIDDYWWLLMIIIVDWWLLMIIDDSNILMDYWWLFSDSLFDFVFTTWLWSGRRNASKAKEDVSKEKELKAKEALWRSVHGGSWARKSWWVSLDIGISHGYPMISDSWRNSKELFLWIWDLIFSSQLFDTDSGWCRHHPLVHWQRRWLAPNGRRVCFSWHWGFLGGNCDIEQIWCQMRLHKWITFLHLLIIAMIIAMIIALDYIEFNDYIYIKVIVHYCYIKVTAMYCVIYYNDYIIYHYHHEFS